MDKNAKSSTVEKDMGIVLLAMMFLLWKDFGKVTVRDKFLIMFARKCGTKTVVPIDVKHFSRVFLVAGKVGFSWLDPGGV